MESKIEFSKRFKVRMGLLALVTAVIISLSMPVTYFVLLFFEHRQKAVDLSQQLAWRMQETTSLILLLASTLTGIIVGLVLYRYPTRIVAGSEDEVSRAFRKLNHLSYHDPLTGLPNRIQLNDRITQALTNAARTGQRAALLFLDLDRFKLINDTFGHNKGDSLLQEVAKRLVNCIRDGDMIARIGGDEFVVLLPEVAEAVDAGKVAQRIIDALEQPIMLGGHELVVTASMGISVYPADGDNLETLVKNADTAMYRAKEQGQNVYRFYSAEMNFQTLERLTMENSLRKALKREELVLHYQPIIDLYSGEIIGMEALVRWQHPEFGLLFPDKFIPVAEETGLIVGLGNWVLKEACAQNKAWMDAGFAPMYVSVNISARQFQQRGLPEEIIGTLKKTGLDPCCLQLEITESLAMFDEARTMARLTKLRKQGIGIAVDDFGTGYSSLGSLKRIPLTTIKIDKTFIHNINFDPVDLAITKTIIATAGSLKLNVIAEGVENEDQLAFLMENGCNAMQGYLFCKPLPATEFELMLRQRKRLNMNLEAR